MRTALLWMKTTTFLLSLTPPSLPLSPHPPHHSHPPHLPAIWQPEPPTITIVWELRNRTVIGGIEQMERVYLQSGQRIEIDHGGENSSWTELAVVEEEGFVTCWAERGNSTHHPSPSPSPSPSASSPPPSLTLAPLTIFPQEMGSTFILQVDPLNGRCVDEGLRLNVTWVGRECGDDMCSRYGQCAFSRAKEVFACRCCVEKEWVWSNGTRCVYCEGGVGCCGGEGVEGGVEGVCDPNPCQHGGICNPQLMNWRTKLPFTCLCPVLYSGTYCEIKALNTCGPHSCPPNNYCFLDRDVIECVPEYRKGLLPRCHPNICYNQGECLIVKGVPRCICKPTHIGIFCKNSLESLEEVLHSQSEGGSAFVALAGFLVAFVAAASLLLVCHCHTYSCHLINSRRRDYLSSHDLHSDATTRTRLTKSEEESEINREGFQMYTVDDFSISSSQDISVSLAPEPSPSPHTPLPTPTPLSHSASTERTLLVTKT